MKSRTTELLVYAKAFYYRGESECIPNTDVSNMLAVLNFHDAVEFSVRAIIEEETIQHSSGGTLLKLIEEIDKHFKNDAHPKKLPFASQINAINNLRNNAKHHATPPHRNAVVDSKVHAFGFIDGVCSEYFATNLASISQVSLVKDHDIRQLLTDSESAMSKGRYHEALVAIKTAFIRSKPSDKSYFKNKYRFKPTLSSVSLSTSDLIERSDRHHQNIENLGKSVNKLNQYIEIHEKEMKDVMANIAMIMMGIDIKRLDEFMSITPVYSQFIGGNEEFWWNKSVTPTHEMCEKALQFTLEMIFSWEKQGVLGSKSSDFGRLGINGSEWKIIKDGELVDS